MADEPQPQDTEHLRLLSIFHYVVAGLQATFACFPIIHFVVGTAMVAIPPNRGDGAEGVWVPKAMGCFFMAISGALILAGWTLAACMVLVGRNLAARKRHTFCLVVAGIESAACMPFGTALGVFTIVVLLRPSVKALFGPPVQQGA